MSPSERGERNADAPAIGERAQQVLVFSGRDLVEGPPSWERLVRSHRSGSDDWAQFLDVVSPMVPQIVRALRGPDELAGENMVAGGSRISVSRSHGLTRVELDGLVARMDPALDFLRREADTLGTALANAGALAWRMNDAGEITWVNTAYLGLAARLHPDRDPGLWPPPDVFDLAQMRQARLSHGPCRVPLASGATGGGWYSVNCTGFRGETLCTAISIDAEVQAQHQMREQTKSLGRAVERLSVGLAMFDRTRRLVLFNPALGRLTGLSLEFLGSKPTLLGLLDRLRETRVMPEPKDYPGWRQKMSALEAAASESSFDETWSLPDGQTYRVTGHPHTEGALVLLFDDITSEVSLTRRVRAELEMGQAVIDSLDDAVAVFSAAGVMTMVNRAYGALWNSTADTSLSEVSVTEAVRAWMTQTTPTPVWGDLRDFVGQRSERAEWSAVVRMRDGRGLHCRVIPIDGGATLTRFRVLPPGQAELVNDRRATA